MIRAAPAASSPANAALPRGKHQIMTPEGVPLIFDLADAGERVGAFLIDLFFIVLVIVGVVIAIVLAAWVGLFATPGSGWFIAALVIGLFLVRTFYFAFFELHWRGATPGKRAMKLRVIDRAGGPLGADAILVRNLMREIEVFLPLTALLAGQGSEGDEHWMTLFILAWSGLFTLFPLFNRDRLRLGDLVAGTCVIAAPRAMLLQDLAARSGQRIRGTKDDAAAPRYRFTHAQLNVYGVMELQTLEEVLRRDDIHATATRTEVARRIRKRIDWQEDTEAAATEFDAGAFLDAFYAAQRGRLERDMLFGVRRRDKNDRGEATPRKYDRRKQ
nr:RDD family protein [uncultured Dongia sp.]